MITDEQFLNIIDSTPLVSIDLIIENHRGDVLLGKLLNKPAQGYWFVPGGRIHKNEKIADAFNRISQVELGTALSINNAELLGAYNHIYDDNYFDKEDINTHYVVLGYKIKWPDGLELHTDEQHSDLEWWPLDEMLASLEVHDNTKAYFK